MTQNKLSERKSKIPHHIGYIVFVFILIGAAGFWQLKIHPSQAAENNNVSQPGKRVPVVVANPVRRTFEQVISTQGNIEAKYVTLVSPRIPGIIEKFYVDEGNNVTAGQTKLFQTEALRLEQNVTIREHDMAVAVCAGRQAQAGLEKVMADFEKAEIDFRRFERLLRQNATTQDIFEQQQSSYKQLAASVKVSQAQVELAAEHVRQAEAALVIARKDLNDTTVIAPINGVISMRMAEPGETGSPGMPVLRIEDTNTIDICAFLPAEIYPRVVTGKTEMKVTVAGIDFGSHIIYYKSPTIQSRLRTFEIKCLLRNPPAGIAPGAMAEIKVILESREGIGVPASAILQRANQLVLFSAEGDTARMRVVQTGFESEAWIEILKSDITESTSVVSMGQNMLDNGTLISIQKEAD